MKSVKCLHCKLVNFADAGNCRRCQNSLFASAQTNLSESAHAINNQSQAQMAFAAPVGATEQNAAAPDVDLSGKYLRKMFFGALWAVGGTIVTAASYSGASGGGRYMIFWGAILFGAIDFLVGLNGWMNSKS